MTASSDRARPKDWLILRMAASRTVAVTASLKEAGFEVWTPMEKMSQRRPRSRAVVAKKVPMMPTYCFARARHLVDLAAEIVDPMSRHPQFSIFQHGGHVVFVADAHLDPLRGRQQARGSKGKPEPLWNPGDDVRITEGPFGGLSGIVKDAKGQKVWIAFPDFRIPIQVSASLLLSDVIRASSETPIADAA